MARNWRLETGAARAFLAASQAHADHFGGIYGIERLRAEVGAESGRKGVRDQDARHGRGQRGDPAAGRIRAAELAADLRG